MRNILFSLLFAVAAISTPAVAQKAHGQVARIVASVPTRTLVLGQTVQAVAVVYDAQGNVLQRSVSWQQYNRGSVAVENATGLITAIRVDTGSYASGYVVAKVGNVLSNELVFYVTASPTHINSGIKLNRSEAILRRR